MAHSFVLVSPPLARVRLGDVQLLWRISGGKITAMQSDWATIEIDGVQHIIHRRPSPANFVLPWRRRSTARSP